MYARCFFGVEKQEHELEDGIRHLIAAGENGSVEFKSSARWDVNAGRVNKDLETAVLKTIAGFMNGSGGTLVIGVGDGGDVTGIERDYVTLKNKNRDGFEQQYIMQLASDRLGADVCSNIRVLFHSLEGRDVCRVHVEPSNRPVFLENVRDAHFYLRTGNTTHELNVREAVNYIPSRWA